MSSLFYNSDNKICRICHGEESSEEPLYFPCKCNGSIKYTHQICILEWLKTSGRKYCEVCGHKISLIPVYKNSMPSKIPIADFFTILREHFRNYLKIYLFIFLSVFTCGFLAPIYTYRVISVIFKIFISGQIVLDNLFLFKLNLYTLYELGCGYTIFLFLACMMYSAYQLHSSIFYLEEPWWIDNDSPHQTYIRGRNITRTEPSFSVSAFIADRLIPITEPIRANNGEIAMAPALQYNDTADHPNIISENYPSLSQRFKTLIYQGFLENVFYLFTASILLVFLAIFSILVFTGMPLLGLNEYMKHITSGSVGLTMGNMIVHHLFICPVALIMHYFLKKRNIFFFSRIFIFSKFVFIIMLEYIITPSLYGYIISRSFLYIQNNDFRASFLIFPIEDYRLLYFNIIGLINIFWISCIFFYINGKLRRGLLFSMHDEIDETTRFLGEILYEPLQSFCFRLIKSYIEYVFFFLFVETILPYYLTFQAFTYLKHFFGLYESHQNNMELYAIIHFLPYLFNCIPYKSIVDHVCQVWLEKSAQLLSLESFFFGSVPLTEGQEVWDRLGSHIYSSVHAYDRCRRTCSEPFIKDENFKLNVYLFIITSVFALSLVTTIILTIFAATGFYFIAIFFHEANDSFHVSILYGFFIFLLTYTLVCAAVHFIHSFCPIRFPDFLLMVYRILTRLFVYIFIIPILNGIIIDLVLNKFKCSNTRTCIVFPIYNWFYGFLFLKFQIIFASLLPHFVIIFFPLLTSLRNTVQTPNSDVLFYEFAILYIVKTILFITLPYILIFGLGTYIVELEFQYRLYHEIYYILLKLYIVFFNMELVKNIYQKCIQIIRDKRYLIGHRLQNMDHNEYQNYNN